MRRFSKDFFVLAGFTLAALVFYWPALFGGQILLPLDNLWTMPPWFGPPGAVPHNNLISDMILENYPWKLILEQAFRHRELPLWNPYEMAGLPYLATGQTGVLYPFTVLFLILGPLRAYGWYSALHQVFAASFTYLLLRRLGANRFGAMVAGLSFAFCFFLTVSYIWPMVLGSAVWLPLILWSLVGMRQALEKGRLGRALAIDLPVGALATALGVLGGHLEITFYATFTAGLYAIYLVGSTWARRRLLSGRLLVLAALALGLGVVLASVQLVPFLEVLQTNNRQGETTYQQVISYALPKSQVFGLLMPDYFGSPTAHTYFDLTTFRETPVGNNALGQSTDPPQTITWGVKNYVEGGGYVGVVPLLLAAIGILLATQRDRWFFTALAGGSLLLAFGSPLYALIYYGLPFFSQLRTPFRWLFPFDFAIAVLAGLGADWLSRQDPPKLSQGQRWLRRGVVWLPPGIGGIGLAALATSLILRGRSVAFASRYLAARPELERAFGSGAMLYSYEFRNLAIFFALLTIGGVLVGLARQTVGRKGRSPTIVSALIVGVIVVDLFGLGMPFASKEPVSILNQRVDLNLALPPSLSGPRLTSLGDPAVLRANLGVIYGLPNVASYDTIIPSRFVRLWSLIEPPADLPYNQIGRLHQASSLASPILDLLGVRYILTTATVSNPAVQLVSQLGAVRIYERPTALPRAFVVGTARSVSDSNAAFGAMAGPGFQPSQTVILEGPSAPGGGHGSATIVSYSLDRAVISATLDGPGWLVLTDANAPGWQATVDGATATVLTADGDFRAVHLTTGTHQVVFDYKPLSLRIGAYLSFLGALVLALLATWPLWRRLVGHYAGQAERVLRNATLPMATSFLTKAIDFGFAALMLRILGVNAVGDYTGAVVMVGYFEIMTNFGLNALIIREVSRHRDRAGRYLADAILLRLALCLVSLPIVALLVLFGGAWLRLENRAIVAFALLALALIPGNVTTTLSALFYAWERIEVPAGFSVVTALVRVTLGTAALLAGAGIIGLAAIALLLNLVLVVVFLVSARRILHLKMTGAVPADLPEMLGESFPLLLNNVLVTVFFKIDVLLLLAYQGSEALGYYAAAYKWVDGTLIVPSTFTFAVYPTLSRFAEEKGEGLRLAYEIAVRVLLTIGIPIAVAIFFLSGDLILLLGGQAYYPRSAVALTILIWFLPFSYLNGLTQYALIAVNRQRFITIAFVIATSFNLIANFLLIPRYGINAAAIVTVLSEVVLMFPFIYAVGQSIGMPNWLQTAGKPVLAGLAMGLVAYVGRAIEPHLALVLGVAVYVGVIWLLKTFSPEEAAALGRVVGAFRKRAAPVSVEA